VAVGRWGERAVHRGVGTADPRTRNEADAWGGLLPQLSHAPMDSSLRASTWSAASGRRTARWVRRAERRRLRRRHALAFGLAFGLIGSWSLATPLGAAPDEAAQVVKAAAVARGELAGSPLGRGAPASELRVVVPRSIADLYAAPTCFAFHPAVPASCARPLGGSSRLVATETYVGRYPPLYYLLVGWPTLVWPSGAGVLLVRLASALVAAWFLAAAVASADDWEHPALARVGVLVAATPQVLFLGGVVNPSGLEMAASVAMWVSAAGFATTEEPARAMRLARRGALAAAVVGQVRPLGVLWVGAAALATGLLWRGRRDRRVWRRAWPWAAIAACSAGFGLGWTVLHHSLEVSSVATRASEHAGWLRVLERAIGTLGLQLKEMVGVFGWLDTPAPLAVFVLWGGLVALVVGLGLATSSSRGLRVLVALGAAAVAVIVGARVVDAHRLGVIGQGRDWFPIAVGVVVVGAAVADPAGRLGEPAECRLLAIVASVVALAQALAWLQALRRYETGASGTLDVFAGRWHPLLPLGLLVGAFLVLVVAYSVSGSWVEAGSAWSSGVLEPSSAGVRAGSAARLVVFATRSRRSASRSRFAPSPSAAASCFESEARNPGMASSRRTLPGEVSTT
jgi:hypothetical protein